MTLVELWQAIVEFGTPFVLFIGVVLFYTGRLVNSAVARQARLDSEAGLSKAHEEQVSLLRQRYEEMQKVWRERYEEANTERNYYRSIALTFAKQAEAGIAVAEVATNAATKAKP